MGYDAACTLTFEGQTERGTAWLEHKDLIFRGPTRLVIPLRDIVAAHADGGTLHVRFGGKDARFQIGESAAKWAKRITNPPSRLDKLGIKAGMRVALVGVRDDVFASELSGNGALLFRRVRDGGVVDVVFYAANDRGDLARLTALSKAIVPAGALWVIRPKGQRAITESDTMAAGRKAGLVDVKVVSFSETHTAEKFVVPRSSRQPRATSRGVVRPSSPQPRATSRGVVRPSSPQPRATSRGVIPVAKRARAPRSSSPSPRKS